MTTDAPRSVASGNQMSWRMLARFVATIHVAYVVFVLLGGLLVIVWPAVMWFHLAAVVWATLTMGLDLGCPLTPWEKNAWIRGGRTPYEEGFLQHHVLRYRFSEEHSRRNHALLGVFVLLLNVVVYYFVFR